MADDIRGMCGYYARITPIRRSHVVLMFDDD
jgi:hypothetical protein